jgi:hypothetical protein
MPRPFQIRNTSTKLNLRFRDSLFLYYHTPTSFRKRLKMSLLSVLLLVGMTFGFWFGFWLGWQDGGQTHVWLALRRFLDAAFPRDAGPKRPFEYKALTLREFGRPFASGLNSPATAGNLRMQRHSFASVPPPAAAGNIFAQRTPLAIAAPRTTSEAASSVADSLKVREEAFDAPPMFEEASLTTVEPQISRCDAAPPNRRQELSTEENDKSLTAKRVQLLTDTQGNVYAWENMRTYGATCRRCKRLGHTKQQCGRRVNVYYEDVGPA